MDMPLPLCTSWTHSSDSQFWNGIFVYFTRPYLANKKVTGFINQHCFGIDFHSDIKRPELLSHSAVVYEERHATDFSSASISHQIVENLLKPYDKDLGIKASTVEEICNSLDGVFICVRQLIGRLHGQLRMEVILFDKNKTWVRFSSAAEPNTNVLAPPFPYTLELLGNGNLQMSIERVEDAENISSDWLADTVFPKLLKWMEHVQTSESKSSLALINVDLYTKLYYEYKEKYGKKLVATWPENTDPLKFVYEDIAIATYLICLWKQANAAVNPIFVDLGCGNGLLVYILNQEGYSGHGIDVRSRKIWNMYEPKPNLIVKTVTPSNDNLYPDVDWIIGNHSDELTPWIPVIAARSSRKTNFFLLPCCSYEFSGSKFTRKDTSRSIYHHYVRYVEYIGRTCGFQIATDKMRIPSTKRTCVVGTVCDQSEEQHGSVQNDIATLLASKCKIDNESNNGDWIANFQPRIAKEPVKNCTQLDRGVLKAVVDVIFRKIISEQNIANKSDGSRWNRGGTFALRDLIQCVDPDHLEQMKAEHGGLQTLLKNHRYIFKVAQGQVSLRLPPKNINVNSKYKSKDCWYFRNHPDRCLYLEDECACIH